MFKLKARHGLKNGLESRSSACSKALLQMDCSAATELPVPPHPSKAQGPVRLSLLMHRPIPPEWISLPKNWFSSKPQYFFWPHRPRQVDASVRPQPQWLEHDSVNQFFDAWSYCSVFESIPLFPAFSSTPTPTSDASDAISQLHPAHGKAKTHRAGSLPFLHYTLSH